MRQIQKCGTLLAFAGCALVFVGAASAAPYASKVQVSGTTVNFILNQDADSLTYSLNGGAPIAVPTGTLKGAHSFTLGAPTDTFSIVAEKTEAGFTTPSGLTIVTAGSGIAYDVPEANGILMSDDTNPLNRFNSPRGVGVNMNPNSPHFGTTYISNSAATVAPPPPRTSNLGDGLYALNADQSDAFGYGDTAQQTAFLGAVSSANTPYKLMVAANGEVYVTGFADALSGVFRVSPDLLTLDNVLAGTTGPGSPGTATCGTCLPVGQNHGSVPTVYVTGSTAGGDLTVYTVDEDMTTAQLTRANATDPKGTDNNKLWRYDIGGSALPFAGMPTAVADPLIEGFSILVDMDRGADGKFYLSQNRGQPANSTGVFVTDASGNVLFNSRRATAAEFPVISTKAGDFNHNGTMDAADYVIWREQQGTAGPDADATQDSTVDTNDLNVWRGGNGAAAAQLEAGFGDIVNDMYSNIFALAVSPDQKWLATLHNNNTIGITPLVNGIPDVANILAIPTTGTISARDIAWDAAGNLHYVSSGQALYRVLAPGGHTVATTSWNGSSYAFNVATLPGAGLGAAVPEPSSIVLLALATATMFAARRRSL